MIEFILQEVATRDAIARLEISWDLRESLDHVQDAQILIALAMEREQQAELITEALTTAQPGFWPIALRIAEKYPRHRTILGNLEAGIEPMGGMIQGPWSAHLERCRMEVRTVLEQTGLRGRVRSWLQGLEASLARRSKERPRLPTM